MYLSGRWIPLETVNAILVLWVLAVIVLAAAMFLLQRQHPPSKPDGKTPRGRDRRRHGKRKK